MGQGFGPVGGRSSRPIAGAVRSLLPVRTVLPSGPNAKRIHVVLVHQGSAEGLAGGRVLAAAPSGPCRRSGRSCPYRGWNATAFT